jgi:hypothetical protein
VKRRLPSRFAPGIALVIAVLCAGAMGMGHAQGIKKWVDEKGVVHFGDVPPPEAKTSSVIVHVSPPGEPSPKPAQAPRKAFDQNAEKRLAAKEPPAEERRAKAETNSNRAAECQTRIAALHREVNAYRGRARNGVSDADAASLDEFAAQEDAWIAKNCEGR